MRREREREELVASVHLVASASVICLHRSLAVIVENLERAC